MSPPMLFVSNQENTLARMGGTNIAPVCSQGHLA
jgi:hypothetical protein